MERAVYGEFAARLTERIGQVRIGPGARAGVGCGPMISARQVGRLAGLVEDAVARGARVSGRRFRFPAGGTSSPPSSSPTFPATPV